MDVVGLTPHISVLKVHSLNLNPQVPQLLSRASLLRHVEVQALICPMFEHRAPQTLQALRSLPQSLAWQPFELVMHGGVQGQVQAVCAAFAGTPLVQAVSKLTLDGYGIEAPIAALHTSFPLALHLGLEIWDGSMASFLSEAIAAWPTLRSISLRTDDEYTALTADSHLEAVARTAAELRKVGEPFEILLQIDQFQVPDSQGHHASQMDALVANIRRAGGGGVDVRWMFTPQLYESQLT